MTFTFTASDANGNVSPAATVTITVTGVDDGPVAQGGVNSAMEGGTAVSGTVTATDADGDLDPNGFALVGDVAEGSLTFNADGSYSFDPGSDFQDLANGETRDVTFTFTASDANGNVSPAATVTITVTGVDDGPVAQGGVNSAMEGGTAVSGTVTATDADGDLDPNGFALVGDVAEGSLTFNADGSYSFDPGADFQDLANGETRDVTFTFTASDANGNVSPAATVTITVTGVDDGPVAQGGVNTAMEGGTAVSGTVTATDADGDLDPNGFALVGDVSEGSLTFNADGSYSFEPGADFQDLSSGESRDVTFTFTASDANGNVSPAATVTITVTGVDDGPVAQGGVNSAQEGGTAVSGTVTATDADGDLDPNGFALVGDVSEGSLTFNADGSYSFDPGSDFQDLANGETRDVTFTFTASDANGNVSPAATVTITVTGVDDGPVAQGGVNTAHEGGTAVSGTVTATDADGDLDPERLCSCGRCSRGLFDLQCGWFLFIRSG